MASRRGNSYRSSLFNPYRLSDRSAPITQLSQDDYGSAADSSSFDRSQLNPYATTGRGNSQDLYNSAHDSSLSRSSFTPSYNSRGRGASQNEYDSAHDSPSGRPASNPSHSSRGKDPSQDTYSPAHGSSLGRFSFTLSYNSRGRDASQSEYNPAYDLLSGIPASNPSYSSSGRVASENVLSPSGNSSSGRPAFNSYGRGGKSQPLHPYSSEIYKSRDHQSYNNNQNLGLPQALGLEREDFTEDRIKDAKMFHSLQENIEILKSFVRPDDLFESNQQMETTADQSEEVPILEDSRIPNVEISKEERLLQVVAGAKSSDQAEVRLSSAARRRCIKEVKLTEGTWLSTAEWRKAKGLKKKSKKKKIEPGLGGSSKQTATEELGKTHGKRFLSDSSAASSSSLPAGTKTSTHARKTGQHERASLTSATTEELSVAQVLSSVKMAIVLEKFPEERMSEREVMELRGKIGDEIFEAEDPTLPRICRSYHERGALILICENEYTKVWVMQTVFKLSMGGERSLVVRDYKDLLCYTKVLLRPPHHLAERDVKQIMTRVGVQNQNIQINEWKVLGDDKRKGFRTITLLIDEYSASSLEKRDWKIYLGPDQVKLKVISERKAVMAQVDEDSRLTCSTTKGPPRFWKKVQDFIGFADREGLGLVMCCDANSHNNIWGSTDTNGRGLQEAIEKYNALIRKFDAFDRDFSNPDNKYACLVAGLQEAIREVQDVSK